jgi:hypothetical protein
VTKFAQASIFSALNNLTELTLEPDYAAICGFTKDEFDALFPERMENDAWESKSRWKPTAKDYRI